MFVYSMDLVNKYWLVDDWSMIELIFIESNNINYIASDAIVKVWIYVTYALLYLVALNDTYTI